MHDLLTRAQNVVFDVGQVLLSFRPDDFIPRIVPAGDVARALTDNLFKDGVWAKLDEGTIDEESAARRIASGAGVAQAWPDMLRVIERFPEFMDVLPAAALLPRLKDMGKRLYVLSNYGEMTFARTQARFPALFRPFDGLVISGREKVCKPDARIYRLLLGRYQLDPGETVFIDDSPPNVLTAQGEGIAAICYTGMDALG